MVFYYPGVMFVCVLIMASLAWMGGMKVDMGWEWRAIWLYMMDTRKLGGDLSMPLRFRGFMEQVVAAFG